MGDLLIKGMKKPETCSKCPFCQLGGFPVLERRCLVTDEFIHFDAKEKRAGNCPLVELITCKECKHWDGIDCNERVSDGIEIDVTDPNEFCNRGRRKEE